MGLDQRPLDETELRNLRWVYSAMVTFVDQQVAIVLDALAASGQQDRTVILYTSDHGDMLGSHGLLMKSVLYDGAARVPMVLNGPGIDGGSVCSTAASLADVFPTAVDVTGCRLADQDNDLPGTSLLQIAGSPNDPKRVAFSEYHGPLSSAASYLVRRGRWKYVHHVLEGASAQLFDIEGDPDELDDRIDDDAHNDVRNEMRSELRAIVDPERLDAEVQAEQRAHLEAAGGFAQLGGRLSGDRPNSGPRRSGPPRTEHGVIAPGWTIPPAEVMEIVRNGGAAK